MPGRRGARELRKPVTAAGSFTDFYREARPRMVRLAHLLTGGDAAAEELVQEAFLRVHSHWERVEHPRAYLRTAVVNQVASHHRRRRLERLRGGEIPLDAVEHPADLPGAGLRDAVATLPHRQRVAIVLRYYEGLSDGEIAAVMGCGVPAVKSLLFRALQDLRRVVEK